MTVAALYTVILASQLSQSHSASTDEYTFMQSITWSKLESSGIVLDDIKK